MVLMFPEYHLAGNVRLKATTPSRLNDQSRRVNRRATINGGVYFDDQGFSHGDRMFEINVPKNDLVLNGLKTLIQTYAEYKISTSEGIFNGTIQGFTEQGDALIIIFLVKERVA